MKRITLLVLFLTTVIYGYSTTWTITNTGFAFTPATITIQSGDDVNFDIASIHQVQEVTEATWNNNGNTPLAGGFSTPAGGGPVSASLLTVGTHWYVCVPHASGGMKGKIIVESTTGTEGVQPEPIISIFPNPTTGKIQLLANGSKLTNNYNLTVFDMTGKKVYSTTNADRLQLNQIDLSGLPNGIYVVKIFDGINLYNRKIIIN